MRNLLYGIAVILIIALGNRIPWIPCRRYHSHSSYYCNYCSDIKGYSGEESLLRLSL